MAEQRFKVGDRVVRTGPTWNGAFNGQTYTVSRVDSRGEMMDLIGVDGGCMFAFEACNFHPADKRPRTALGEPDVGQFHGKAPTPAVDHGHLRTPNPTAHPWASELRKFKLVGTDLGGAELEGHPFLVVEGTIRALTTEGSRGPGDDVDWACNEIEEGYTPTEALC